MEDFLYDVGGETRAPTGWAPVVSKLVDTEIGDRREGRRGEEREKECCGCFISFSFRDTLYVRVYVSRVLEVPSFVRS